MGVYVYRVTSKKVKCSDGEMANVAVFAYKPWYSNDKENARMHFQSGCVSSDNMAARQRITDRIAIGNQVFENVDMVGSFYDSQLDSSAFIPLTPKALTF